MVKWVPKVGSLAVVKDCKAVVRIVDVSKTAWWCLYRGEILGFLEPYNNNDPTIMGRYFEGSAGCFMPYGALAEVIYED